MDLTSIIKNKAPLPLDEFMDLALSHPEHGYYIKQDPFGAKGDFVTAPEISQLFGEIIALWIIERADQFPFGIHLVEFGGGRGTLMHDALRIIEKVAKPHFEKMDITLIETSPALKKKQQESLKNYNVSWLSSIDELSTKKPIIIIGNEFLDALPIKQFRFDGTQWHEHFLDDNLQTIWQKPSIKIDFPPNPELNDIYEYPEIAIDIIQKIIALLNTNKGSVLWIDYGHNDIHANKDTLQALRHHAYAPFNENIGDQDITSHVNFALIRKLYEDAELITEHLYTQGDFLQKYGINIRAQQLVRKNPDKAQTIMDGWERLIQDQQMGTLFKCLITHKI